MFDTQRVPQWMSSQLPTAKRTLCSPKPAVVQPSSQSQSQSQSQQQMKQQQMKQPIQQPIQQQKKQQNGTVIALGSVTAKNASPDDAFFSGAWLFDAHSAPQWLTSQLPVAEPEEAAKPEPAPPPVAWRPSRLKVCVCKYDQDLQLFLADFCYFRAVGLVVVVLSILHRIDE
ncbi:hypothetical protein BC828DRAFT_392255 [Blastocladiella britannica]|nr:hypothetical protein BC828DRAFT_392255 [Blastocladiella britannica]